MYKTQNNYAFIDSQNLNLGIFRLGWKIDYKKFRVYLQEKYSVKKAYLFIGFMPSNKDLYAALERAGFILRFKQTVSDTDGKIKGNVDADLVLAAVLEREEYEGAVIGTSDGDFYSLVQHLYEVQKLAVVLSPDAATTSRLLRQTAKEKIHFMNSLKIKLEHKRKAPHEDGTS